MLTDAQKTIVTEVCSIQYDSLIRILLKQDLGEYIGGESYEDILSHFGLGRADFDKELILTIENFKNVANDPETVYSLSEWDLTVFKHILYNFRHHWEGKYPKALSNLWNKLFVHAMINEINKN